MRLIELAGLLESAGYKVHRGKSILTVVEKGFAGKKVYVHAEGNGNEDEPVLVIKRFNWRDLTVPVVLLVAVLVDQKIELWELAVAAIVAVPFVHSLLMSSSLKELVEGYIGRHQREQ